MLTPPRSVRGAPRARKPTGAGVHVSPNPVLEWLYDPRYEEYGPGAAHGARIYWDAGTGAVDFSAPHATVLMNHPMKATRYTWQSGPLTDGQTHRFVLRVATAPWPDALQTQNTDEHAATADSSVPTAPILSAQAI